MKWILACALGLVMCMNADARPHFKGKVRQWRHNHPVRQYRHKKHNTVHTQPKCKCCGDNCKCSPKCDCPK